MNHLITYYREANPSLFAIIESMNNLIKSKLELLPTSPGCYIHKDKNGTIIYVGRPRIYAIGCGPISEGATIPRRKPWYLRLWILSLSSPSPILRPCFLRSTSSGEQAQVQYHAPRTISPIPSSRLPMNAIRASSSRARSKGWWSLFWSLSRCGSG